MTANQKPAWTGQPMQVIDIRNSELMATLATRLTQLGVRDAALTLIGGVDSFRLSTMPADDPTTDVVTDYNQPGELTGTGEVVDGIPHIHAVLGVEGDHARAGHLHAATVATWFVRVYVTPVTDRRAHEGTAGTGRPGTGTAPHP